MLGHQRDPFAAERHAARQRNQRCAHYTRIHKLFARQPFSIIASAAKHFAGRHYREILKDTVVVLPMSIKSA